MSSGEKKLPWFDQALCTSKLFFYLLNPSNFHQSVWNSVSLCQYEDISLPIHFYNFTLEVARGFDFLLLMQKFAWSVLFSKYCLFCWILVQAFFMRCLSYLNWKRQIHKKCNEYQCLRKQAQKKAWKIFQLFLVVYESWL